MQLHQEERRGEEHGSEEADPPPPGPDRPKLIINIMSGSNDEKSVVMGHEEMEAHDQFYEAGTDVSAAAAPAVVLRHPRVPPLHG